MIKVLIKSVVDATIGKLFNGTASLGSEYKNRALFQHYGFSSLPPLDSQGIVIKQDNHYTCIASEPPEGSKPTLVTTGDVVIYTASGTIIKVNQGGTVEIQGNGTSNSIKIGTGSLQQLVTATVLSILETATMPVAGAVAGPYPPGTFTVAPGNKTSETVAS